MNEIKNSDCIEEMSKMKDNCIDLIIADIPYGITTEEWDRFNSFDEYLNFIGEFVYQSGRVLKPHGNLYLFHSDFDYLCEINNLVKNNTSLINRNLIIWNKYFDGCKNHYLKQRNLCRKNMTEFKQMAEYILLYSFESKTENTSIQSIRENFSEYKDYIQSVLLRKNLKYNSSEIITPLFSLGYKSKQSTMSISLRLFHRDFKNFGCLTKKQYDVLNPILNFDKSYSEILDLYNLGKINPIKKNKIQTKNTFNNQNKLSTIWNYDEDDNKIHVNQKPRKMIEDIVIYSSNVGDMVLDPFAGSGIVNSVCKELGRNSISFEKDEKIFKKMMK